MEGPTQDLAVRAAVLREKLRAAEKAQADREEEALKQVQERQAVQKVEAIRKKLVLAQLAGEGVQTITHKIQQQKDALLRAIEAEDYTAAHNCKGTIKGLNASLLELQSEQGIAKQTAAPVPEERTYGPSVPTAGITAAKEDATKLQQRPQQTLSTKAQQAVHMDADHIVNPYFQANPKLRKAARYVPTEGIWGEKPKPVASPPPEPESIKPKPEIESIKPKPEPVSIKPKPEPVSTKPKLHEDAGQSHPVLSSSAQIALNPSDISEPPTKFRNAAISSPNIEVPAAASLGLQSSNSGLGIVEHHTAECCDVTVTQTNVTGAKEFLKQLSSSSQVTAPTTICTGTSKARGFVTERLERSRAFQIDATIDQISGFDDKLRGALQRNDAYCAEYCRKTIGHLEAALCLQNVKDDLERLKDLVSGGAMGERAHAILYEAEEKVKHFTELDQAASKEATDSALAWQKSVDDTWLAANNTEPSRRANRVQSSKQDCEEMLEELRNKSDALETLIHDATRKVRSSIEREREDCIDHECQKADQAESLQQVRVDKAYVAKLLATYSKKIENQPSGSSDTEVNSMSKQSVAEQSHDSAPTEMAHTNPPLEDYSPNVFKHILDPEAHHASGHSENSKFGFPTWMT